MTRIEKAVKALDEINTGDPERAHGQADTILLAYAPKEIRDAYERVVERSAWWASS